jgi:hypothetical protein
MNGNKIIVHTLIPSKGKYLVTKRTLQVNGPIDKKIIIIN